MAIKVELAFSALLDRLALDPASSDTGVVEDKLGEKTATADEGSCLTYVNDRREILTRPPHQAYEYQSDVGAIH